MRHPGLPSVTALTPSQTTREAMIKKSQPAVTKTTKPVATATPAPMAARGLEKGSAPTKQQPAKVAPVKPKSALVASGGTKIQTVVNMLRAKQGASLEQLSKATGWQHHSVRGAISGNVKKKLGLNVTSERVKGVRIYRIGK